MNPRRKAISTVLTTMIILVASVVLGTGVVLYGTSLFQTGAKQESISTQGVKIWVNATDANGIGWGAAAVRNSGDKLVSVDHIIVRGTDVPYSNWYVDKSATRVTTTNFQAQFNHTGTYTSGMMKNSTDSGVATTSVTTSAGCDNTTTGALKIDEDEKGSNIMLCLTQASGPVSLNPGDKMVVYFRVPNGILSSVDSGTTTGVSIFAGKTGSPQTVTVGNP